MCRSFSTKNVLSLKKALQNVVSWSFFGYSNCKIGKQLNFLYESELNCWPILNMRSILFTHGFDLQSKWIFSDSWAIVLTVLFRIYTHTWSINQSYSSIHIRRCFSVQNFEWFPYHRDDDSFIRVHVLNNIISYSGNSNHITQK